jgi:hypothetical protein
VPRPLRGPAGRAGPTAPGYIRRATYVAFARGARGRAGPDWRQVPGDGAAHARTTARPAARFAPAGQVPGHGIPCFKPASGRETKDGGWLATPWRSQPSTIFTRRRAEALCS